MVDETVARAGRRLAGPHRRRSFVAGAGAGVAALVGAKVLGFPRIAASPAETVICGYARDQIAVCYAPWRVTRSEPHDALPDGFQGVALRKGPFPDADIVYRNNRPVVVPVGGYFGRMSRRYGGIGCPDPGPRPAQNGFVWGYPTPQSKAGNKPGWFAMEYEGTRFAEGDNTWPIVICGPASLDFDCRAGRDPNSRFKSPCGRRIDPEDPARGREGYECGGDGMGSADCSAPVRMEVFEVHDPEGESLANSLSFERYNLKWEADSTTFYWLVPGDVVSRHCEKCVRHNPDPTCPPLFADSSRENCCHFYACVEVVEAKYVPAGTRGWVESTVLRRA